MKLTREPECCCQLKVRKHCVPKCWYNFRMKLNEAEQVHKQKPKTFCIKAKLFYVCLLIPCLCKREKETERKGNRMPENIMVCSTEREEKYELA